MKFYTFTNFVLHLECVTENFYRFLEQLFCGILVNVSVVCEVYGSLHDITCFIRHVSFIFLLHSFSLANEGKIFSLQRLFIPPLLYFQSKFLQLFCENYQK